MFYWIYDIPNWQFALLCCLTCSTFGCLGLLFFRPLVRRTLGPEPATNDLVSYFVSAYGVFYGLMLGLIAVGTYENFSQVDATVSNEASTLSALYLDVSMMPEPYSSSLRESLVTYATKIVDTVWPDQKKGIVNKSLGPVVEKFYRDLLAYEPETKAQVSLQKDTLERLNKLLELRRQRINSVTSGLPSTLYCVVIVGAALNLVLCWLFSVDKLSMHLLLVTLLATFIGLVIFLVATMDNPYRGEFCVSPEAFESFLEDVKTRPSN